MQNTRSRNKMLKKKAVYSILIIIGILLLTSGLVYYFNYRIELVRHEYNSMILELAKQTKSQLQDAQNILNAKISIMGSNLSSQIGLVDNNLQNFKKQNEQEINTLSSLIDQIEQQSNIKLNELKDELKNIKINSADFSAIVNDVLQSVVSVQTNIGQGSGAIINSKGYIITNVHVISGASSIRVVTYSGTAYNVDQIIGYNDTADIAVLKISASGLKALNFGNSDNLQIGEKVIAAGNPAGLAFTVTEGIVSALRTAPNRLKYVQTDVPINPGNSGGPLVNIKGEIVGINNFKVSGFESLGFALSSNDANNAASKIISDYESTQNQ